MDYYVHATPPIRPEIISGGRKGDNSPRDRIRQVPTRRRLEGKTFYLFPVVRMRSP